LPATDRAEAQLYFVHSLAFARQQQAKSWELRAAMSVARLWRDQGKPQQAREQLAPVYGWFTEGFDTLDPKEGRRCWTSWRRKSFVRAHQFCSLIGPVFLKQEYDGADFRRPHAIAHIHGESAYSW
jgi:hypothetical protein